MSDTRPSDDAAANRPDPETVDLLEDIQALQGEEMPVDQDAFLEQGEFEGRREQTRTELDQGDPITDPELAHGEVASVGGLASEGLRDGETDDVGVAVQEGYTWVPPSDPPIVPTDGPDGVAVGAGTAASALEEPYDGDHRGGEDFAGPELTDRITEALRADAQTSVLDGLLVEADGPRVTISGTVQTVDDADAVVAVIERVTGVTEVIDQTELAGG